MRRFPLLLSGLMLAALAETAPAQQPLPLGGGPPLLDSAAFEQLGLTADQRAKIQAIHERVQTENAPLRQQAQQIMGGKSFRDLTPAQRDSLRPKLQPVMAKMRANAQKGRDEIMKILTPEQQKKYREQMQQMRGRMRERMGEHDST
ncbi:MAG TPA: Spy/CpxP family protein refolding chaperone [Gemmatimonadales bacterium]|nr:Spy/CpxP family protein refolding chaperone [Gemmatimonadales bacterium]